MLFEQRMSKSHSTYCSYISSSQVQIMEPRLHFYCRLKSIEPRTSMRAALVPVQLPQLKQFCFQGGYRIRRMELLSPPYRVTLGKAAHNDLRWYCQLFHYGLESKRKRCARKMSMFDYSCYAVSDGEECKICLGCYLRRFRFLQDTKRI